MPQRPNDGVNGYDGTMAHMAGTYIEHLTWQEAERAHREFPVALVPLGARCKEHGPHLPLNNDFVLAEALAARVVARVPVLAYPTIPYGTYPAFVDYPGSVSINADTFTDFLVDLCTSIARHGAERIYVLNTGISTNKSLAVARQILTEQSIRMDFSDLHVVGAQARAQVMEQPEGTHADELETSLMLYLAPEVVRQDAYVRDISQRKGPGKFTRDPGAHEGLYSPTGVYGDATLASREKGEIYAGAIVDDVVSFLQAVAS